jgi:hypothetical protein
MLTSRPRLYWKDQLANWEAYSILNTLRLVDLARSCIWALARQEAVCASIVARSALETAAAFVDAARTVTATITGPPDERRAGSSTLPSIFGQLWWKARNWSTPVGGWAAGRA